MQHLNYKSLLEKVTLNLLLLKWKPRVAIESTQAWL
jgi:hypothetical protein